MVAKLMALSGLGAATIRALTPVVKPFLSDSCIVNRPTHTSNGAMGYSDTMAVSGTYTCYVEVINRLGGKENEDADRVVVWERYRISFMAGTDILPQDQITQVSSGVSYTVTNNIDTQTSSPTLTVNAVYASK